MQQTQQNRLKTRKPPLSQTILNRNKLNFGLKLYWLHPETSYADYIMFLVSDPLAIQFV